MKNEKKVLLRVTSYEGDTEFSLLPKDALKKIAQLEKEENKWTFIDGKIMRSEVLTEEDLLQAESINIVNSLAGGDSHNKAVEIEFEVNDDDDVSGLEVKYEEFPYNKKISIEIGSKDIYDILSNRELIVAAIRRKLNGMVEKQIDDLKKALNV